MINVKSELLLLANEKYKAFHSGLANTGYEILGITAPKLKQFAKDLSKNIDLAELDNFNISCYEELTLFGLIVAYKKASLTEKIPYIKRFVELNDNWASNDGVTAAIKNKSDEYFDFLCSLLNKGVWQTRFAVTSFLSNFLDSEHLSTIFDKILQIQYGDYYVDMAVAWFLSIAYIKQKKNTFEFLNTAKLPKFVLQKTISKICDSKRVEKRGQAYAKGLAKGEVMLKGDILELEIESVGMDGEGVAKVDGMVIFVPFTLVGEVVKCQITFIKKKFAKAKVIKLLKGSPLRETPACPHFRKCGGCAMQHINYERQLEIKRENIINCFKKNSNAEVEVEKVIPSSKQYFYRNKAQFPLCTVDGKVCLGFFKEGSHDYVKIDKCFLQDDWCDQITDCFLAVANQLKLSTYNESTHKGLLRHLVLRKMNDAVSITIVVNSNKFDYADIFAQNFAKIGIKFSLYISFNTKTTNLIMYNAKCVYGEKDIETEILDIKTMVNPMSFMQINDYIRDEIYTKVQNIVGENPNNIVIDAYSGVGVLTNIIAKNASKVYGIEIVSQAVENANQLAKLNGNEEKITNICGDSAEELPKLLQKLKAEMVKDTKNEKGKFIVVLDPPRKGCDQPVLDSLIKALPDKIVYVSCNPATLARDFATLKQNYTPTLVQPYDMFPQTTHVETVVLLSRQTPNDYLEVNVELDDDFLTKAESKGTYDQIKQYIFEKYKMKVSNLYIAQVKDSCGIKERANYNHPKKENSKQPQVPEDKRKIILEALKVFKMI